MTGPPPLVPGKPLFGNALNMISDPLAFLVNAYHNHGSIFRLRALGREITVVAGLDANLLLRDMGADLAKGGVYTYFNQELGQDAYFSAVDGETHLKLRRAVGPAYAGSRYTSRMPALIHHCSSFMADWHDGEVIPVVSTLEHVVSEILGTLLTGYPADERFADFRTVP